MKREWILTGEELAKLSRLVDEMNQILRSEEPRHRRRQPFSPESRAKMAMAAKKRWAKVNKKK